MSSLSQRYRTALVTGAGSGLGDAFTTMLLREGVRVWGTARDPAKLPPAKNFSPLALELSDPDSIDAAWAHAERESGGIDLLINNAGAGAFAPFVDAPFGQWRAQFDMLAAAPARLAHHALCAMRACDHGAIVNVTSLAVEFPLPMMSGYNAGKAALAALSASLLVETVRSGIAVIDFRPGDFRTRFNASMQPNPAIIAPGRPLARTWERLEASLAAAPAPALAARDLRSALLRGRRGVVRSGSFFQAVLAPLLARFAPLRLSAYAQRRYYHVD